MSKIKVLRLGNARFSFNIFTSTVKHLAAVTVGEILTFKNNF